MAGEILCKSAEFPVIYAPAVVQRLGVPENNQLGHFFICEQMFNAKIGSRGLGQKQPRVLGIHFASTKGVNIGIENFRSF